MNGELATLLSPMVTLSLLILRGGSHVWLKLGVKTTHLSFQRNCLHFALTTRPALQWKPKYEIARKKLMPWINSVPMCEIHWNEVN